MSFTEHSHCCRWLVVHLFAFKLPRYKVNSRHTCKGDAVQLSFVICKPMLCCQRNSRLPSHSHCRKWTTDQIENAKKGKIAVLYASAYGNTAGMAQAISRGITKAGIGVETLNLEEDSVDDALAAVKEAKGFIIGSPTLGGHLPTQVDRQTHLALQSRNCCRGC